MVISPFIEWEFKPPTPSSPEGDQEYRRNIVHPIIIINNEVGGENEIKPRKRFVTVRDLHDGPLKEYEFVQLLRVSCSDVPTPISFPISHIPKYPVWRTVFANTTQFEPPTFTKGVTFVAYFHLDSPLDGLEFFKNKLREFDNKRGDGERRLLIDPVPPESDDNLNSQLIDLPADDPLSQYVMGKNEGGYNDEKRALTRVYGTEREISNLLENTSSIHTSMYFNKTIYEVQNLNHELSAYGVQQFIMDGDPKSDYGIEEFVLESLRYVVTQFNSQEFSLVGTQTGINTRVGGRKANILHTTMYDPLLLLTFSGDTALTLYCDVEKADELLRADGIIGWPGGRNSLWHLLHKLSPNSPQHIIIRSFWDYLQDPCLRTLKGLEHKVNEFKLRVIEQSEQIYKERILDGSSTLEPPNEWSVNDFITFLDPKDGLDDEEPVVLGNQDKWNLGRLQHLKKVVEMLDSIEGINDSDPFPEYAVLFWHLTKFPDFVRLITSLFKNTLLNNYQCLSDFEIGVIK
jgi:hypothetical protein